jgi:Transposase Tn5 dimerisation domain/Transposase DNA-binding
MDDWISAETATARFGDLRLDKRFAKVLKRMAQKPSLKFAAACKGRAEIDGAYRFVRNPKVDEHKVLKPHHEATIGRIRAQPVVLVVQDTTEIDVTRRREVMTGAGPLNDASRVGFYDHALLVLTPERIPLGVVHAEIYARDPVQFAKTAAAKRLERKAKPIEDKESLRWLEGYRAACRVAERAPETAVVSVSDSEGDIFECLMAGQGAEGGPRADWIVRACQDRRLTDDADDGARLLRGRLAGAPIVHRLTVEVRAREPRSKDNRKRKQPRSARTAEVTVRAMRVRLRGPQRPGGKLPDVEVNAVLVREPAPPDGEEPIEWILLTSLAIGTVEEVLRVVEYYGCRWQIEIYHRILKSGCKVEESQLEKAEYFRPYLALCLIVAWRVQYLLMLGRECPELPCDVAFDDPEWQSVYAVVKDRPPPTTPPTMGEMVKLVAALGGYQGRRSDGEPGPKAMWIGLQRMTDLAAAWQARGVHRSPRRDRDPPSATPKHRIDVARAATSDGPPTYGAR